MIHEMTMINKFQLVAAILKRPNYVVPLVALICKQTFTWVDAAIAVARAILLGTWLG